MNIILALAGVVIKELYRRKDFYVLLVLTALITLAVGSVSFFNDPTIVRHIKDLCLLLIWISSLIIAVGTTARQLPAERENRTIFPLLAKPVTRAHVILGKFFGCWFACGIGLVVFYVFFVLVSGSRDGQWPIIQYVQALWLHWMALGVVTALVLLGSVVFAAPSSNATISVIIVVGIFMLGGHLNQVASRMPQPAGSLLSFVYYVIPHLEWNYNVRERMVYAQPVLAWLDCALATLYAAVYSALLLFGAWFMFRRKPLNL